MKTINFPSEPKRSLGAVEGILIRRNPMANSSYTYCYIMSTTRAPSLSVVDDVQGK